jgi:uncharacterized protein (TIGR03067 family)
MKKLLLPLCFAALLVQGPVFADDLEALSGKWSVKKVSDQGQNVTQTIEIKKDKFVFQVLASDDSVVIYAEGDFKLEKLGPFSAARFFHIRGGSSPSNIDDVDDVYVSIYSLDGDAWTMAANFDKQRDGQKPSLDIYKRIRQAPSVKTSK